MGPIFKIKIPEREGSIEFNNDSYDVKTSIVENYLLFVKINVYVQTQSPYLRGCVIFLPRMEIFFVNLTFSVRSGPWP